MKYFVTGATGCIGGWVVKNLVEAHHEVYALVRGGNLDKLSLIMSQADIAKVHIIPGDIVDGHLVESVVVKQGIQKIIHLAAMQLPFCKADPKLGAKVNVEGTINIFEAAKKAGIPYVVYASSTAVYGTQQEYGSPTITPQTPLMPHSLYGVYKQANEASARVYYELDKISSVGIRPYVVYGPLRDQGMTASPTTAMKSAAKLIPYQIAYGGTFNFQYVDDTAKVFIRAADLKFQGAEVFNLGGNPVQMSEVVQTIAQVQPKSQGLITYIDQQLPFPPSADNQRLQELVGQVCQTSLFDGIRQTMEVYIKNPS